MQAALQDVNKIRTSETQPSDDSGCIFTKKELTHESVINPLESTGMQGKPIAANKQLEQALAHRRRCKALPPLQPGERERLITAFLAVRSVTVCPPRYAAPVESLPPTGR